MGDTTIEWAEKVWNCLRGCSLKSQGCTNCYAMRQAHRFSGEGQPYEGLTRLGSRGPIWTGEVLAVPEKLAEPMGWRKPALVFVNSMSDLFHEDVPDEFIAAVFGVMAACQRHTFQVLTKRPERIPRFLDWIAGPRPRHVPEWATGIEWALKEAPETDWPLPNVWLGVSVEDQARLDERADSILRVAERGWLTWLSAEPLLGAIDASDVLDPGYESGGPEGWIAGRGVSWMVVGGESGPGARPMHPDWARSLRDQCRAAGVPFFFKQWGEWVDWRHTPRSTEYPDIVADDFGPKGGFPDDRVHVWPGQTHDHAYRAGKKAAGRLLDGREWNEMPRREAVTVD